MPLTFCWPNKRSPTCVAARAAIAGKGLGLLQLSFDF
jgi:hypothetical protein